MTADAMIEDLRTLVEIESPSGDRRPWSRARRDRTSGGPAAVSPGC
ncbi:hypothetical protein [Amycolatopsis sp. NPDC102389]